MKIKIANIPLLFLLSVIFLSMPIISMAANDNDPECGDPTAWSDFDQIVLNQSYSSTPHKMKWHAFFDKKTNDILIKTDMQGPDTSVNGSIAMVGGRIMMSKELKLEPGYEIDTLDTPILSMKLIMIMLGRVFPNGPTEISGYKKINYSDKVGIKYATLSASGHIPPNWTLSGSVNKITNKNITFDLALTFSVKQEDNNKSFTMNMRGEFKKSNHTVFNDTEKLEGWTTYGLGPRQIKQANNTILDYGATADANASYKTIGDIRKFIAAENNPGFIDTTKDFTGFWKEKCDNPYGLQIMHYGNEGKYSIVFCGPGGCGEQSDGRLTYITGDKHFEIISENKLVDISRSGEREIYYRCTKETHPVLKYKDNP